MLTVTLILTNSISISIKYDKFSRVNTLELRRGIVDDVVLPHHGIYSIVTGNQFKLIKF